MAGSRDPRVDVYIAGLPGWQQRICTQLRELLHEADPAMDETIKRRDRPGGWRAIKRAAAGTLTR